MLSENSRKWKSKMHNLNRRSRRSKKEPRALRPNQFMAKWHEVQQENTQLKQTVTEQTEQISTNTIDFFECILGFKPYAYQKEFIELFENNQFTAARWCRQSGKTETISALLLKYAVTHSNAAICIVGPSWRQTKRIITRILAFAHKLPPGIVFKPQKTQIHFVNGSSIEASPNNPKQSEAQRLMWCTRTSLISWLMTKTSTTPFYIRLEQRMANSCAAARLGTQTASSIKFLPTRTLATLKLRMSHTKKP